MIAAENQFSGFVTYFRGNKKNKVFWKSVPYQLTAAHLKPNPDCDGTWIRNLTAVGQVKTLAAEDPNWGFVPQQSIAGIGDVAQVPFGSLTIDQMKATCIERGYSAFVKYPVTANH